MRRAGHVNSHCFPVSQLSSTDRMLEGYACIQAIWGQKWLANGSACVYGLLPPYVSKQPAGSSKNGAEPISLKRGGSCLYVLFVSFSNNYKTSVKCTLFCVVPMECVYLPNSWTGESLKHFVILTLCCFLFKKGLFWNLPFSKTLVNFFKPIYFIFYECKPKQYRCIYHCHKCTVVKEGNAFCYSSSKSAYAKQGLASKKFFHTFFYC